jgi:tetratricopeptide (TPR) repeat protein
VAATTPGEYIRLSSETIPPAPDASLSNAVGPGCRPRLAVPELRTSGAEEVRASTLAAPKEARKAYDRAQKFLAGREPNYAQAARQLEKAVQSYAGFALAWDLLGVVRNRLKEEDRGKEAFENAIKADPSYVTPYLRLAAMAMLRNRMEDALRLSDVILRLKPGLREAHDYRAVACYSLGKTECAVQSARAVLETGPDQLHARLHLILGDVLARQRDFRAAAAEYSRLIELAPDSPAANAAVQMIANWKAQGILAELP